MFAVGSNGLCSRIAGWNNTDSAVGAGAFAVAVADALDLGHTRKRCRIHSAAGVSAS